MNKVRRSQLEKIVEKLEELQGDLYSLSAEEEEYYENMPEGIQDGEKGERAQEVVDMLEEAGCAFDDLVASIREAAE